MRKLNLSFYRYQNGFLYAQIYSEHTKAIFSTGIKVSPHEWNGKPKGKNSTKIQKRLDRIRADLERYFDYLKSKSEITNTYFNPRDLVDMYLKKNITEVIIKPKTVLEIIYECETHRHNLGLTNSQTHKNNLRLVERICKCFKALDIDNITFEQFSKKVNNDVILWLKKHVFRNGSIYEQEKRNTYLKRYQQILERANKYALACEYTNKVLPKFERFSDDRRQTPCLTVEELARIENLDLQHCPDLEKVRDVFIFSVYTTLNFADMQQLDKEKHIHDDLGMIIIPRKKTNNPQYIPIFPKVREILEKYNYKLPLSNPQYHNKQIKLIAKLAGVNTNLKNIQNRTARTTGASFFVNNLDIELSAVSKMMGHKNIKVTEDHYIKNDPLSIKRKFEKTLNQYENENQNKQTQILEEILQELRKSKSPQAGL